MRRAVRNALLLGAVLSSVSVAPMAQSMKPYESVADQDFMRPTAKTARMRERLKPALDELRIELLQRQHAGDDLVCARQILLEAHWLLNYTNRERDLEARIAELQAQIAQPDRDLPGRNDPADDGFGRCHKEWFFRVDDSFHRLSDAVDRGTVRPNTLRILAPINTPELLSRYFERLRVSDVERDGVDQRKELNVMVTAMAQLLFLPKFATYVEQAQADGRLHPGLSAALRQYMDERWQDTRTGYWGAAYRTEAKVVRTSDLSITFHIVSYRDGQVQALDRIIDTTFAIREQPYPFGWEDLGRQNTHHSYDVVRLLRLGWPRMTAAQQERASAEIAIMLSRVLRLSLRPDGSFDDKPFASVAHAYYFGVSFLDEVGYFRQSRRFWTDFPLGDGEPVRQRIENRMRSLGLDDPMLNAALQKIAARD